MRGLVGTSEATKLVVSISLLVGTDRPGQPRSGSRARAGPMERFFERRAHRPRRHDHHLPPGDHHRHGRSWWPSGCASCCTAPASASRCGPTSTTARSTLLNGARARPDRPVELGRRLLAGGGRRHPHRPVAVSLESASLSLLIVNAYAAAIFGRLRSLPLTFVGAIVIGLTEGYLAGYLPEDNQYLAAFRLGGRGHHPLHRPAGAAQPAPAHPGPAPRVLPRPDDVGAGLLAGGFVIVGGRRDGHDARRQQPDHLRPDLPARPSWPCRSCPLVGLRRPDLARAAQLRRHRGHRRRPPRRGRIPLGLVLGVVVVACSSAGSWRCPVLRLSGIYLALATAAFAVALDRWIFNLPDFDIGPVHISLFELGSTEHRPAVAVRLRVRQPRRRSSCSSAVAFAARGRCWSAAMRGPRSAGSSSPCATARRPAPPSGST